MRIEPTDGADRNETPLGSWKEIGAYLYRDERTVRRWEKEEGLPVHRHAHKGRASVYAYPSELDAWRATRKVPAPEPPRPRPLWKSPAFAATVLSCLIMVGNSVRPQPASAQQSEQPLAQRVWDAQEAGKDYWGHVAVQVPTDGQHAIFTDWKNGNLLIRDFNTGQTRFLTQDHAADCPHDLLVSRDSKQIALRCDGLRGPQPLRILRTEGSHWRDVPLAEAGLFLASWSPDSKQIAATKYSVAEKSQGIDLIAVSDGSITRLKSTNWGAQPQTGDFSPDGRFLVYSLRKAPSAPAGVFTIAVDGTRESALVQSAADYTDAKWTPDGKGVVFLSDRSGTRDLWFIRVADGRPQGEPVVVRPDVGQIDLKGFVPDGSLYYGTNQLDSDLYQIAFNTEGGTPTPKRISERLMGANFEPEPSPDGTQLAFFRGVPGNPDFPYMTSLVIRSVTTGKETTLLNGLFVDRQRRCIRWFPDGTSLLLQDWKSFRRVNARTGDTRILFETPDPIWMHADLSHDGKSLFYSSLLRSSQPGVRATLRLIRRDLETGQEKVLYQQQSDQAGLYGISLSPGGTRLTFMTSEGMTREGMTSEGAKSSPSRVLVTMPERGGAVTEVFRAPVAPGSQEPLHWWGAAWSRDGRYILTTRSVMTEKQSDELVAFPVDGGRPRVLTAMAGDIYDPTASPDGKAILFTNARRSLELWVMRNFLPGSDAKQTQK